jgi:hypothetical protein
MQAGHVGQHAALVQEHQRSGPIPPTPPSGSVRQASRAGATSSRSCSAARRLSFFHVQPARRSARPTVQGAPARPSRGQPVAALRQRQGGLPPQRQQRRLDLACDARRGAAAHPLGRAPPLVARRGRPAIRRRAAHREPLAAASGLSPA